MTDNNIKPTKPVDHCIHIAALRWAQAAYYDGLAAEAERRGHIRMSIKHAETAAELRRPYEADARGTGASRA
jgi:predicted HD phosphohydrolase